MFDFAAYAVDPTELLQTLDTVSLEIELTGLLMNELIIGNLIHRPLRSVISAFAVAIEVVMILSITAVMLGMVQGSREQTSGIGMDMVVRPGSTSNLLTGNAASASVKAAQVLEALPHVKVAAPFNVKFAGLTSKN